MTLKFETLKFVSCASCYKEKAIPKNLDDAPDGLILFELYIPGWTYYRGLWFCRDCRPDEFKIDPNRHPRYRDYMDSWGGRSPEECKSHDFKDEQYDPYAVEIQGKMCACCKYMKRGYEDDGSSWMMCTVENPKDSWGHNLYCGHFYGAAIDGRLCPYFTCRQHHGRDPAIDKANGTFHVPYNELYDGD